MSVFVVLCCHVNVIMPCSFFQDIDDEEGSYNDVPVGILCHEQENITPHTLSLHHTASSLGNIMMDAPGHVHCLRTYLCTASQLPKVSK